MAVGMAPHRALYACDPGLSRGRLVPELPSRTRSEFRRDGDRIIHATAFRRLQYKTQVFVIHEGDHYRTRLTHTLEVAQIARALARQLGLDEDLTEALALAHDLGHPPFGHAGERALDACLADHRGFDHNAQTLRVVTALERRYPDFDGLNLCWETLEGIVKHNGPLIDESGAPTGRYREYGVPQAIVDYVRGYDLELANIAGLEAQVAALADDIAYDAHDIDDGLRAGLFTIDDLRELPLMAELIRVSGQHYPNLDTAHRGAQLVRELISSLIGDVMAATRRALAEAGPASAEEVRKIGRPLVCFSRDVAEAEQAIKAFLKGHMYRHPRVMRIMTDAESIVRDLFGHYQKHAEALPEGWLMGTEDGTARARRIGDFIAGMTDRFAMNEHGRFFDSTPDLR